MHTDYRIAAMPRPSAAPDMTFLSMEAARRVRAFHKTFPQYSMTPLKALPQTAELLGVASIHVKDESFRFGLNAFKVLGGSYAIGSILADRLGLDGDGMTYGALTSPQARRQLGQMTFITATDGNHGRGVAWAAREYGHRSVVRMPAGSASERLENIRACGADAAITDCNYDDTVRLCARMAQENGWTLVQDTAWDGYEQIPMRIMQGYMTMGLEAMEQLPQPPTHLFLQAGVGSMAAAIAELYASAYGENRPTIIIVEPNEADCFYRTAAAADGALHAVTGSMPTIMAGLACGEPCSIAWDVLSACADYCVTCPDEAAARGMRILGNPWGGDERVISGESGASGFGCAAQILTLPELEPMRRQLGLSASSRLLFLSTEGATDRANYRRICWEGLHANV
ncbi:MAG: diaminopropionate ammonia-lyase [Clostridia bacterium]|nr:diaminopropionate ammonia-lyase [Clostridia bacterium]